MISTGWGRPNSRISWNIYTQRVNTWRRNNIETYSALLNSCEWNPRSLWCFHSQIIFFLQSVTLDVSFTVSQGMLLNKQSSGLCFGTPWRSCGVSVMTMVQNLISQSADCQLGMDNHIWSGIITHDDVSNERVWMFPYILARTCCCGWWFDTS